MIHTAIQLPSIERFQHLEWENDMQPIAPRRALVRSELLNSFPLSLLPSKKRCEILTNTVDGPVEDFRIAKLFKYLFQLAGNLSEQRTIMKRHPRAKVLANFAVLDRSATANAYLEKQSMTVRMCYKTV